MSREQLLDISSRFLTWINSRDENPSALSAIVAKDVVLRIPFQGATPDLAGLLAQQKKANAASSDFKVTLLEAIVDEIKSTVVHFIEISGTHEGQGTYVSGADFL